MFWLIGTYQTLSRNLSQLLFRSEFQWKFLKNADALEGTDSISLNFSSQNSVRKSSWIRSPIIEGTEGDLSLESLRTKKIIYFLILIFTSLRNVSPPWIQNSNGAPAHHTTETVEACYTCFLVSYCALLLSSSLFSFLALKFNFSYLAKVFFK